MGDIPLDRLLLSFAEPSTTRAVLRDSDSALSATPLSGMCVEPLNIKMCHKILGDSTIPIIGRTDPTRSDLGFQIKNAGGDCITIETSGCRQNWDQRWEVNRR
jgi:hypothetical protein